MTDTPLATDENPYRHFPLGEVDCLRDLNLTASQDDDFGSLGDQEDQNDQDDDDDQENDDVDYGNEDAYEEQEEENEVFLSSSRKDKAARGKTSKETTILETLTDSLAYGKAQGDSILVKSMQVL